MSLPTGRREMRVRSAGLMRNRDLTETPCRTRRGKNGEVHAMRGQEAEGASQSRCRLPQRRICGRLRDAMRTLPCGLGGLQRHLSTVPLQALRFASALLGARAVAASPRATDHKESAVPPHPRCLGPWPTAPAVDSVQSFISISVRAS